MSPWQRSQVESAEVPQAPHVTSGAFFTIKLLTRRAQRRPIIFHKNGNDRAGRIARRVVLNWVQEKHLRGLSMGQTRALVLSDASKQSSTGRIKARNKFTDPAWPRLAQLRAEAVLRTRHYQRGVSRREWNQYRVLAVASHGLDTGLCS